MGTEILLKNEIKSEVLKFLSGYYASKVRPERPNISALSPWIGDVTLQFAETPQLDEHVRLVYGISSINLPFALLLLKLDFGADITVVTRPPTEKNYRNVFFAKNLLEFLDEIGCNIYIHTDLHSKLLLSNDRALLGSFNLTFPALWGQEEIGAFINDVQNQDILRDYMVSVISKSKPYGFTAKARSIGRQRSLGNQKVTRGWLLEELIQKDDDLIERCGGYSYACHEFLFYHFKTILSYDVAKFASADLDSFYAIALTRFLDDHACTRMDYIRELLAYQGQNETDEIFKSMTSKLARPRIPQVTLEVTPA